MKCAFNPVACRRSTTLFDTASPCAQSERRSGEEYSELEDGAHYINGNGSERHGEYDPPRLRKAVFAKRVP